MISQLKTIRSFVQARPIKIIAWTAIRKVFSRKIPTSHQWISLVKDKAGLEIGGPSGIFFKNNYLPVYPFVKSLDGVNFSNNTIWEGKIEQGNNYRYGDRKGFQYIAEGTILTQIKDNTYDFILSCNNLEHIANPIKSLLEWKRVVKPEGIIILILPRKESNFDHLRPITSFQHIKNDFEKNTGEDDLSHLNEILELHDLKRDPHAKSYENFKKRSESNLENRSLHHHVFDMSLLKEITNYIGMRVLISHSSPTDNFIAAVKND